MRIRSRAKAPRWLLLLLLMATAEAQDFTYTTNDVDGTIMITGCTGPASAITIPSTINGLPVTRIGNSAFGPSVFYSCTNLTSVAIPDTVTAIGNFAFSFTPLTNVTIGNSVTSIGTGAFDFCTDLARVVIPESVTSIGANAFRGCESLTNVTIPHGVTQIGAAIFIRCTRLSAIAVDALNSSFSSLDGVLFNKDQTMLIEYPAGRIGNYSVPDHVTSIADSAFSYDSLAGVSIPHSVYSIGPGVFASCTSLTNVTIESGVTTIAPGTFSYCTSLTSVSLPSSITSIAEDAFFYCTNLPSILLPKGVTSSIGHVMFDGCSSLTNISVDALSSTYSSVAGVLFDANRTTLVKYPLGRVGNYTVPGGVTKIAEYAFYYCTGLTDVILPDSVVSIGDRAFLNCSLSNLILPNSVKSIGVGAFNLTTITNLVISKGISLVSTGAFTACYKLSSVSIPEGVVSIADGAFSYCRALRSVVIPASLISIADSAFSPTGLQAIYFKGNAPVVGPRAFDDPSYSAITMYYLPGTSGWGPTFGGFPTAVWHLPNPIILKSAPSLGIQGDQFGFTISWATNLDVVVEVSTNLGNPSWQPLQTNSPAGGTFHFSDPRWTNYPTRFYRIRSP